MCMGVMWERGSLCVWVVCASVRGVVCVVACIVRAWCNVGKKGSLCVCASVSSNCCLLLLLSMTPHQYLTPASV